MWAHMWFLVRCVCVCVFACACMCVCVWCGVCWYIINNLFKTLFGNLVWKILRFCGNFVAILQLRLLLFEHPQAFMVAVLKSSIAVRPTEINSCSIWKSERRLTSRRRTCRWCNETSRAPGNDLACGEPCRSYFEQQAARVRTLYRYWRWMWLRYSTDDNPRRCDGFHAKEASR